MNIPLKTGYSSFQPTLCIGFDIAWFGGSSGDKCTQFDFLAATLLTHKPEEVNFQYSRIPFIGRDPQADILCDALITLLESYKDRYERLVFAVDAPLQARIRENLPSRKSRSAKGTIERRACEQVLSKGRMAVDKAAGGSSGWQPNVQPGAPLAPRVEAMISRLQSSLELWNPANPETSRLMIECFPAEAIWAAKRQGWYPSELSALSAKAYKKQKRNLLGREDVVDLVSTTLYPFAHACEGQDWKKLVDVMLTEILSDESWKKDDHYLGGKMLDDVVDSMICLCTSISYALGAAHVWLDEGDLHDGHIIGPGTMHDL